MSILSLPHCLAVDAGQLGAGRYLAPPADRAARWQQRLGARTGPRVGIAWSVAARDAHAYVARHKSVPADVLRPLLDSPGVTFHTLQPGPAGAPSAFGDEAREIVDLTPHIGDFADTAALVDAMDLVIAPDTAVAHLAGALGKPVWLLDRFNCCWRWRLGTRHLAVVSVDAHLPPGAIRRLGLGRRAARGGLRRLARPVVAPGPPC